MVAPLEVVLVLAVAVLLALAAYVALEQKRLAAEQRVALDELRRASKTQTEFMRVTLESFAENLPMVISDAFFEQLHGATFAILDDGGHPVCCGFFVTPCGVALTAAHSCDYARAASSRGGLRIFRASTFRRQEFSLALISAQVGALDIAVLRVISPSGAAQPPLPPRDFLPLPSVRHTHQQLLGAPVSLIHGSIAWSAGTDVQQIARDDGKIITSNETMLQYSISPYKGHSGAALLFRSGQVIGLHSGGFNDLEQQHSDISPSTSADAVRLDSPEIRDAVERAKIAEPLHKASSSRRRRQ
jgi:hypothetical protein